VTWAMPDRPITPPSHLSPICTVTPVVSLVARRYPHSAIPPLTVLILYCIGMVKVSFGGTILGAPTTDRAVGNEAIVVVEPVVVPVEARVDNVAGA
jgi:hypothetical protein